MRGPTQGWHQLSNARQREQTVPNQERKIRNRDFNQRPQLASTSCRTLGNLRIYLKWKRKLGEPQKIRDTGARKDPRVREHSPVGKRQEPETWTRNNVVLKYFEPTANEQRSSYWSSAVDPERLWASSWNSAKNQRPRCRRRQQKKPDLSCQRKIEVVGSVSNSEL